MKAEKIKDLALNALDDLKARDVITLDVREMTDVTDFMEVVVHVMLPDTREFYDLERLWSVPAA